MNQQVALSRVSALVRRGKGRSGYLWIAGVVLYLAVVWYVGWGDIQGALFALDYRFLALLVFVEVAALSLRAWKWRLALGPGEGALRACFISKGGGNLTPGRVGEFAPLLSAEHRSARVGAWIILDRVLEASATVVLGLFALIVVIGLTRGAMLIWWALAVLGLLVGAVLLLSNRGLVQSLSDRVRPDSVWARVLGVINPVSQELANLRERAPLLSALSVVATLLDLVVGYLLYLSFGVGVAIGVLALAQLVHALTSTIPIAPNATGIPYAAAAAVLYEIADVPLDVLTAAVGIRFLLGSVVFWGFFLMAVSTSRGRSLFRGQGELFDQLASGAVLYEYSQGVLEKLDALVKDKGSVLDVGCGDGVIGEALNAERKFGVDLSPRCAGLSRNRGLSSAVADASKGLPFAGESFDTVICIDVLHHLGQDWDTILGELDRVLRSKGRLCIVEPDARNRFVRWTQSPRSPIRVAPWHDEPAIDPKELTVRLQRLGYDLTCEAIHIEGRQTERSVFPMWQRLLKAPFVLSLAWIYRKKPNKFALVARKRAA